MDLLLHSAGTIALGRFAGGAVDDFDRQYQINVRAPYSLTQMLLPLFVPGQGQIFFINSSAGLQARAGVGQHSREPTGAALRAWRGARRRRCLPNYGVRQ